MIASKIESSLLELLREPTCFVGVGNVLRRDDAVGPRIVGAVRAALKDTPHAVVDAQDVPENFVPGIARSDRHYVVFVDAVAAEGDPGTVIFGPLADFPEADGFSTHKLALSLSRKFLEAAGKKVFLLGIVPGELAFGEGLTAEVARAAASVEDAIIRAALASRG